MARLIAIAVAALALVGLGAIGERWLHRSPPYAERRIKAVMSQGEQARFNVVLLGDSFVELADVPLICGARPLNAGMSGAKAADTAALAERLLPLVRPKLAIVNIGVNDAHKNAMTDPAEFRASLARISAAAAKVGARVTFLRIAPLSGKGLSTGFDIAHVAVLDREIGSGVPMPALASTDGLHPNAAGYVQWKRAAAIACQEQPNPA